MRAGQLAFDARFTGRVIAFVCLREGSLAQPPYRSDQTMIPGAAAALVQLLTTLRTSDLEICLFAHSMGCAIVTEALRLLGTGGDAKPLSEIVYGAPDVSAIELEQIKPIIRKQADRVTIYTSWRDPALYASTFINRRIPIGLGAPRMFVVPGCESIDASRVWHQFYRLDHGYVFGSSRLLADIHLALKSAPQTRYELRKLPRALCWEFVPNKS